MAVPTTEAEFQTAFPATYLLLMYRSCEFKTTNNFSLAYKQPANGLWLVSVFRTWYSGVRVWSEGTWYPVSTDKEAATRLAETMKLDDVEVLALCDRLEKTVQEHEQQPKTKGRYIDLS